MKKFKTAASALALTAVLFVSACSGSSSVKFEKGTCDSAAKKYTSEVFGISVTLDENWTVADDSKLAQLSGMTSSSAEDFNKQVEEKGTAFDFYAQNNDESSGTSINITVENLKLSIGAGSDEKKYLEVARPLLKEQFEKSGASFEQGSTEKIEFAGKEVLCHDFKVSQGDVSVYEIQIPIKKGNYIACITFASHSEDEAKNLVKKFTAV